MPIERGCVNSAAAAAAHRRRVHGSRRGVILKLAMARFVGIARRRRIVYVARNVKMAEKYNVTRESIKLVRRRRCSMTSDGDFKYGIAWRAASNMFLMK